MRNIPIVTFINKVDREGLHPLELMDEIASKLALDTSPVTWPVGMGVDFRGGTICRLRRLFRWATSQLLGCFPEDR